jgi:hypothetical protein
MALVHAGTRTEIGANPIPAMKASARFLSGPAATVAVAVALVTGLVPPSARAGESGLGPLRVHPGNARYFTADGSRAVLLTGSHTWDSLQDMGASQPPAPFDFEAYLDFLAGHGHNFIRLWRWELLAWDTRANDGQAGRALVVAPHPWARTGPGPALDGLPRFDLERFDDDFFDRLRGRVTSARARGIYVSVMLFEGWGLQHVTNAWKAHPFHPANHVGGVEVDADVDGDARGIEVHTLKVPAVTRIQEAYVRRVVESLDDLDNVLYEIANESGAFSTEWQEHFIRFIHDLERRLPRQHPVGMTFQHSRISRERGSNTNLFRSSADWISPDPAAGSYNYRNNPPSADGRKVILSDTDHLWGIGGDVSWAWKSFVRGLHPIFMDPYRQGVLLGGAPAKWESLRRALGVIRRLADRVDLAGMVPEPALASSGFCLAHASREWIAFLPSGTEVTLDLSRASGDVAVEWIDPVSGEVTSAPSVEGGGQRALASPRPGPAVVHAWQRGK